MPQRILCTAAVLAALTLTLSASAQITNPIRYTWVASSCETWNCAAAALIMANGDKYVMALPTGRQERPWLILKRVEEGSIYIPDDEPFGCEVFDTVSDASVKFDTIDTCHAPMMLTLPDGRSAVTSAHACGQAAATTTTTKRRAAGGH
jgi:hypothetical protein